MGKMQDLLQNLVGSFFGPCYTLPSSFMKIGLVVFCNPVDNLTNKPTNQTKNFLTEVIKCAT